MMERTPVTLLAASLLFAVAACGDDAADPTPDAGGDVATDTSPTDAAGDAISADASPDAAVDASSDTGTPDPATAFADFAEPGPYGIGYRRIEAEYTPPGSDEVRTLPVTVWYPTEDESGVPTFYQNLFQRRDVYEDATVAETGAPLPVLVFSHGNQSFAEQSFFMTEHWATHGWVVVSPDHVGNSQIHGDDAGDAVFYLRPLDITATLDALYGLGADDPVGGRIGEDVVMTGHSFGGYTTLVAAGATFDMEELRAVCASPSGGGLSRGLCDSLDGEVGAAIEAGLGDERIDLAIPQTPAGAVLFGGDPGNDGLANIAVPTLLMTAGRDATLPDAQEGAPIWDSLLDDHHARFHLPDAGHFTFSNMCTALPGVIEDDGCGEGFIDPDRAYELVNVYALAFAHAYLWEDAAAQAIVDGELAPPDGLELTQR